MELLELQVQALMQGPTTAAVRGAGSCATQSAGAASSAGDPSAGAASSVGDDQSDVSALMPQQPMWWGEYTPVPEDQLMLAKRCEERGWHCVGEYFSIEDDSYGDIVPEWRWFASVRDRGCHQFGLLGETALSKPGAKWKFWMEGKKYFNARLVCVHCKSLLMLSTQAQSFKREDDEKVLHFFMLKKLKHPQAMLL